MECEFIYGEDLHRICLKKKDNLVVASIEDEELEVDVLQISSNWLFLLVENHPFNVYIAKDDTQWYLSVNGENYSFLSVDENGDIENGRIAGTEHSEAKLTITAPMPGSVLKINVEEGEDVKDGQCLIIVEAMKMETELCSTVHGKVKKIHVKPGNQVDAGEILIELGENSDSS